jgi:acid phosphatase
MRRLSTLVAAGAVLCLAASPLLSTQSASAAKKPATLPGGYKHLVVIYEENHSFDNLYGGWGSVNGHHVVGRSDAPVAKQTQVAQDGTAYGCLLQNDVNLTSPDPLSTRCRDNHGDGYQSHFFNRPFSIDDYIKPTDTTCPPPGGTFQANGYKKGTGDPGGCTRDIVHRFYQEQYQLNGGKQNRYVTGSDAVGLVMGSYKTRQLPIYRYLHTKGAPKYVLADHFFQAAFGGSFLNHQWLVAARSPLDTAPASSYTPGQSAKNSVLDANGMPTSYPQYTATGPVVDDRLTQKCAEDPAVDDYANACGDFAVNTIQPGAAPHGSGPYLPLIDDTTYPNIGDRMTDAGISWAWYSGGWHDAASGNPGPLFQYHHQPLAYFENYAPGKPGRSHLRDEKRFFAAARGGHLPTVSFVKPYGAENEHPGYASEATGSDHLVRLLKAIMNGPQARKTLVVVTYDEFGGQWDHVSPPKVDNWGPGTRIPALVLSRSMKHSGVDHTVYDTTSILATIERSYGLAPLSTRDARVRGLARAVAIGGR